MGGTPDEERPRTAPRPDSSADEALDVHTEVVHERGRWVVEIVVVFADGVVRRRISDHPTEARARISARLIRRAAERDLRDLR
ncbi:hypothetical protein [Pseudonocardia sp. NPDC046786]|uniref:hypothetical protein n=1 Tax=Pseudonocardia sp. NPDC046786 TaxID=3155471 RepID=UPI0034006F85